MVRNRTEYSGLTAETLQDAVYLAASGEAAADHIEEVNSEQWCGLVEAIQDRVPVPREQRMAAEVGVKRRLDERRLPVPITAPAEFCNARERATTLAALRMWQRHGMAEAAARNYEFVQTHPNEPRGNPPETLIATNDFRFPPLSSAAIDDLCDRLSRQE
jgi:transposase